MNTEGFNEEYNYNFFSMYFSFAIYRLSQVTSYYTTAC